MKILVQNCVTHLYLKYLSEWTSDAEEAQNFVSSHRAMIFCAQHRLPAVQIVLKFDSERYDISLPITEECDETAGRPQRALLG